VNASAGVYGGIRLFGGLSPLHVAASAGNVDGIRALKRVCDRLGIAFDIDRRMTFNSLTALDAALFVGTHAAVSALLELGADVHTVNNHGGHAWTLACHNERASVDTLELLAAPDNNWSL